MSILSLFAFNRSGLRWALGTRRERASCCTLLQIMSERHFICITWVCAVLRGTTEREQRPHSAREACASLRPAVRPIWAARQMLIARHIRRVVTCAKSLAPTLNYSRTEAALSERLSAAQTASYVSAVPLCVKTCGHHGLPNLVTAAWNMCWESWPGFLEQKSSGRAVNPITPRLNLKDLHKFPAFCTNVMENSSLLFFLLNINMCFSNITWSQSPVQNLLYIFYRLAWLLFSLVLDVHPKLYSYISKNVVCNVCRQSLLPYAYK